LERVGFGIDPDDVSVGDDCLLAPRAVLRTMARSARALDPRGVDVDVDLDDAHHPTT
jgi:hypothetical protein